MKRFTFFSLAFAAAGLLMSACDGGAGEPITDPDNTTSSEGLEYAPQMYHSIPYEPYTQLEYNEFTKTGENAKHPAKRSVARGKMNYWPYPHDEQLIQNTELHAKLYEQSAEDIQVPDSVPASAAVLAEGEQLYATFCDHCHGAKGEGGGPVFEGGYIGAVKYSDPARINLPYGKMYYSITYGKGSMGSHASQLTPEERWALVRYVRKLQGRSPEAEVDLEAENLPEEADTEPADMTGEMAAY
jgi:mono/diheme cytochrome c family protein